METRAYAMQRAYYALLACMIIIAIQLSIAIPVQTYEIIWCTFISIDVFLYFAFWGIKKEKGDTNCGLEGNAFLHHNSNRTIYYRHCVFIVVAGLVLILEALFAMRNTNEWITMLSLGAGLSIAGIIAYIGQKKADIESLVE